MLKPSQRPSHHFGARRKAMPCAIAPLVVESDEELGAWDSTWKWNIMGIWRSARWCLSLLVGFAPT